MHTLTPGKWYLRFTCRKCQTHQVLFPDLSDGTANLNGASYSVSCGRCGYSDHYETADIERYQHPPKAKAVRAM